MNIKVEYISDSDKIFDLYIELLNENDESTNIFFKLFEIIDI